LDHDLTDAVELVALARCSPRWAGVRIV